MSSPEIEALDSNFIVGWVEENYSYIRWALRNAYHIGYGNHYSGGAENGPFISDHSGLSELDVCGGLFCVNPPPGFKRERRGAVKVEGEALRREHVFYYNHETDEILCFTPGQFVRVGEKLPLVGERLAKLKMKAPALVHILENDGIGYVFGKRLDIQTLLGLTYLVEGETDDKISGIQ